MDDERRMDEQRVRKVKDAHARIAETLIQSAAEPRLRQQLLDRPATVFLRPDAAEADSHNALIDDLRRQIATQLMDRVAQDPDFASLLRQDLFQAIRTAGLAPQVEQLRAEKPVADEVTGFGWGSSWWWVLGWLSGWG
jgi:hypothetical protein